MNNPAQLTLYINGAKSQSVSFPSTNSWDTTYGTKHIAVTVPANATLKFQVDAGDSGANLDFIQIN
jgi:hypothetical protein